MPFRFDYKTYQDVRHNLLKYSVVPLVATGLLVTLFLLPPDWKKAFLDLLTKANLEPWKHFIGPVSVLLGFSLVAFLLVEVFKVHDKVYDKYVVKWRLGYDRDFILPRLLILHSHEVGPAFFRKAEANLEEFMTRLFYTYVMDHDTKIKTNLLVRFYERVTIYWLTQVNEILLVTTMLLIGALTFVGPKTVEYRTALLVGLLISLVLFALNRLWVRVSREGVREATIAEINAILADHKEDLERRIRELCKEERIPFGPYE